MRSKILWIQKCANLLRRSSFFEQLLDSADRGE